MSRRTAAWLAWSVCTAGLLLLASSPQPLRMAVAGTQPELSPPVVRAGLRRLLPGGAAGVFAGSPNGRYGACGRGVDSRDHLGAFPFAAVSHREIAVAPLEVRGVGGRRVRSSSPGSRSVAAR